MTVLLIVLYIVSFAFESVGAALLITDIRRDQKDLRDVLESRATAESMNAVQFGGAVLRGALGAQLAQSMAKQNVMDEYTLGRLRKGYGKRWLAAGTLFAGVLLGTVANILSAFP